jgi:hypothetical protein
MAGSIWEEQFKVFLKRAGDDLKRMGEDIRTEAQRLVTEMKDPERQEKMREGLRDVGTWARRTANDVADLVEKGAQKAETAFRNLADHQQAEHREAEPPREAPRPPPTASRPEPSARATPAGARKKAAPRKTVGPAPTKKKAGSRTTAPKKSIGRKPRS